MTIQYDGNNFHGWQVQAEGRTVQGDIEDALSVIYPDEKITLIGAGRTDAGVHALGQAAHIKLPPKLSADELQQALNGNLNQDVRIDKVDEVGDDFHARFSALSRAYRYVIYNHPVRPALGMQHLTWNYRPLDVALMQQAADVLVGEHDFSSFQAQGCQAKSPVRTIHHIKLRRHGHLIVMDIQANAFLQHMVRNIAGVLMAIGCGKEPLQWVNQVLDHRNRALGGVTAPPFGLFFMRVGYPEEFGIPEPEPDIPFMPLADTLS